MEIREYRVLNYKGFRDTGWLEFGPRFNVIVGENNSGKTALLETMRFRSCASQPHRSADKPRGTALDPHSHFQSQIEVSGTELKAMMIAVGTIRFPLPFDARSDVNGHIRSVFAKPNIELSLDTIGGDSSKPLKYPAHGLFPRPASNFLWTELIQTPDRQDFVNNGGVGGQVDEIGRVFDANYERSIYVFRAQRFNLGTSPVSDSDVLAPDGANLPAVLSLMQGNPARYERFNAHVRSIFPSIKQISVVPQGGGLNVRVWSIDTTTERDDLAIRLEESGTGVSQALAILYVAMTRTGNVIVVDEPNSFLHPGAAKKLIQILKIYDANQYIISTHSPELIAVADPSTVQLVRWNGKEGVVEQLDHKSLSHMSRVLSAVGATLSDVFGADRIVWVEGPTERETFPLLAARVGENALGTSFVALRNTGDLESKRADAAATWDIYEAISAGPALVPPTLAFSLDSEDRTDTQRQDLVRRSSGKVHFLPRRMFENYLLFADAIAASINEEFGLRSLTASVDEAWVQTWLDEHVGEFVKGGESRSQLSWCDAPKLLSEMFKAAPGGPLSYEKTTHSVAIFRWLLANKPDRLQELQDFVASLLKLT